MEQILIGRMRAQPALDAMSIRRAEQIGKQKHQLEDHPPELKPLPVSGGAAGLRRVVGHGKRKVVMAEPDVSDSETSSDEEELSGGAAAYKKGKQLARHLQKTHGKEFLDQFHEGLMKAAGGCAACMSGEGRATVSAVSRPTRLASSPSGPMDHMVSKERAACTMPKIPGARKAIAAGDTDYAPPDFARNSIALADSGHVDLKRGTGRAGKVGRLASQAHQVLPDPQGAGSAGAGPAGAGKPKMTAAERGRKVAELMRTKGMTLPEASRFLKSQH